uniref:NADH dehydrogenase subunit 4L n=1 Tax=Saxidomus purpurata TaxID=311201 RepID=A0A0D4CFR5_9BIVA|nr:NADH dehydrogenase subunit 4L [Saxidomus purpurata]AJT47988.1 NADH dehydrogenase subunit 4L [Saxidomus purpurata]
MMGLDICFFFFFFFAIFHLFYQAKIFLNMLLVFELLTFLIFCMGMFLSSVSLNYVGFHVCLLILCFGVVETVMGLAILISCSRYTGKTKFVSFSSLKF